MNIERQIARIAERAELHKLIDEMGDDGHAIIVVSKPRDDGPHLEVCTYGHALETEFMGLLGYAQTIMQRSYFTDDD